jgi:phage I-like protein
MEMYIAKKPVRFDRDYTINEEIPANAINPKMLKRLIEAGKIVVVTVTGIDDLKLSESIEFPVLEDIEELLGIEVDETLNFSERLTICKDKIKEIVSSVKNETDDGDEQLPKGAQVTLTDDETNGTHANQSENEPPQEGSENNTGAASDTAQFKCAICGKEFPTKAGLSAHMKAHK